MPPTAFYGNQKTTIDMIPSKICGISPYSLLATLSETNIFAPENCGLEDDFPFGKASL